MPRILSGAVLQTGSSSSFITLADAQPALQITPSTNTGFTVIVNTASNVEYSNILGDIAFDAGSLTNYTAYQDISIYNLGAGYFQVYTSTYLNSVSFVTDTTNSISPTSGAFRVSGGVGINKNLFVGGITNIRSNTASTGTQTGSLVVNGGIGVGGDIYLGGNLIFTDATQGSLTVRKVTIIGTDAATNTQTGALTVAGGVGVGGSLYATKIFDSGTRVISTIIPGNGISVTTSTGPTVLISNTGVLSLSAGTGTRVSSTTGNITVWVDPELTRQTLQQVTSAGNNTTNAVFFNNLTNAVSTITAGVVLAGGLGVGKDVQVGGTITTPFLNVTGAVNSTLYSNRGVFNTLLVTGTNFSTSTVANNALYVAGGVGIGSSLAVAGDTVVYGNLYVQGTLTNLVTQSIAIGRNILSLSTSSLSALQSNGSGVTVGPIASPYISLLFDGVSAWLSQGSIDPNLDLTYNLGSSGLRWNRVYGGSALFNGGTNSISTQTGAVVVQGGIGVSGSSVFAGQIKITNATASSSVNSGALIVQGGVGVTGDIYAGNIYSNGILLGAGGGGGGGTGSTITNIIAGPDISVFTNILGTTIGNTSTLQTVTDRGNTTVNPIIITNGNNSYNALTGALQVFGGVAVGSNLYVGSDISVNGRVTNLLTTNTYIADNIVDLHYNDLGWNYDDDKDIGLKFNYYYGASTATGFLGRVNSTGHLVWYSTGTELDTGLFVGTAGIFETGELQLTSTGTATLSVIGGATINGAVRMNSSATVIGTLYSGPIYSNLAPVLTAANLSTFGVANIISGTGTAISTSTGNVIIWSTANLNSVLDNGNSTYNKIVITNTTTSVSTTTGALVVNGGVGIGGNLTVGETITTKSIVAATGNITSLTVQNETVNNILSINSSQQAPLQILSDQNSTSSIYINNTGTGNAAHSAVIMKNNIGDYIELGMNSAARNVGQYAYGSGYLYTSPLLPSLNIGNKSPINFYTQDITSGNPPALSIANSTTLVINNLLVEDNSYSNNPSANLIVQSNANTSYSRFTLKNANTNGKSYTFEVGGNNRAGQNGAAINEGSLTIYDDVYSTYRLIIAKDNGNVLINTIVNDTAYKLQVSGAIKSNDLLITNSATISQSLTVGVTTFNGAITVNTSSIFNGYATFNGAATFNGPTVFNTNTVVVGSSALQTSITQVNTTNPTSIDRFDSTLYRSAKSLVQVQDGNSFYIVEVVLLVDNSGTVYISQYGIITTDSPLGEFSTSLVGNNVVLYFTAYTATSKRINVVQTAIGI